MFIELLTDCVLYAAASSVPLNILMVVNLIGVIICYDS